MNVDTKKFPDNYPSDAVRILKAMAFNPKHVQIIGSMSLRSQLYAGDYDANEYVPHPTSKRFQQIIRNLTKICWVGDIKCGEVPELKPTIPKSAEAFERIKFQKENKPHVVRWTVHDVMKGYKILKNQRKFTLEEGFKTGMTKVDAIGFIENNRYTDFSMNYHFEPESKKDFEKDIKEDILYYNKVDPFKAMKREFSLAKFRNDVAQIKYLLPILNSDLGIIYSLRSDIGTLLELGKTDSSVQFELDQMKIRISHITLSKFVKEEPKLLKHLESAIEQTTMEKLQKLYNDLDSYLR